MWFVFHHEIFSIFSEFLTTLLKTFFFLLNKSIGRIPYRIRHSIPVILVPKHACRWSVALALSFESWMWKSTKPAETENGRPRRQVSRLLYPFLWFRSSFTHISQTWKHIHYKLERMNFFFLVYVFISNMAIQSSSMVLKICEIDTFSLLRRLFSSCATTYCKFEIKEHVETKIEHCNWTQK